ncbi:amidohydrolase family protein [Sandaracinus amylolyticus]|uniref:amidohydrolase family protein n=1 Tax=Sandaracinus amylolyticus TaxID=927083 RepID=UPI001F41B07C|nr:amidohydrolase family protein [Sandaracinus amylolyticus]UJR81954.1 Amidohydro-rel domain-containing protein [Sandaracinus amylolyticus]
MRRLATTLILAAITIASDARAEIEIDGERVEVIDMHLHPGHYANMATEGRRFITESLPPFARMYAPALIETLLDPYGEHVGIRAQTEMAGVDHAVLFAVYAPRSTGFYTNEELERVLDDPRNAGWAWGMVSIDYEGFLDEGVAQPRLDALASYFERRPDLFVGIKLAHAHQAVTLDDTRYLGVYDVAARFGVPVLLHTGFSPFPGTQTDPAYYDPEGLESVVTAYDGAHGMPRVDFVLSHVGQGDPRAVEHALALAEAHDNVWLEISALNRPFLLDDEGEPIASTEPQYPAVLRSIRARGLVERTLFATDGPQFSGMVRSYVQRMVLGMREAEYSLGEIRRVTSGTFSRLYLQSE